MARTRTQARPQISAEISAETKRRFEAYTEAYGLKKGYVLEQALLHHMQAMRDLPADVIVPARVTVTAEGLETLMQRFEQPQGATEVMTAFRSGDYSQFDDRAL